MYELLVTPFRENQMRNQGQNQPDLAKKRRYNRTMWNAVVVEHAFGLLKGRLGVPGPTWCCDFLRPPPTTTECCRPIVIAVTYIKGRQSSYD